MSAHLTAITGTCGYVYITGTPFAGALSMYITSTGSPSGGENGNAYTADYSNGSPGGSLTVTVTWYSGLNQTGSVVGSESVSGTYGTSPPSAPGAPTGLTTTPNSTGVTLAWTAPSGGANVYGLYRDGAFLKNTTGTSTTDAVAGAHDYYVVGTNTSACGNSTGPTSNTVNSSVAPSAPALNLPASSSTFNSGGTQRFSWTASFPTFGDNQSAFDLRYSKDSGVTWTTISGAVPNQYTDIAGGTFTPGSYEWQVRTYNGQGQVGPWSTSSFFTAAIAPAGPTITYPIGGQSVQQVDSVSWSFAAQQGYQVRRVADDGSGDADTSTLYFDTGQIINAATRTLPLSFLVNNRVEHVQVRILANGLWSVWVDVTVDVSYTPPPTPDVVLTASDATASLTAAWTTDAPSGTEPPATNVDVYLNDGTTADGVLVASAQPINGAWTYWVPASGVDYSVQLVANADNGTSSRTGWIFGDEGAPDLLVELLPDGRTMRLSGTSVSIDGETLTVTADPPELTFPDADTMHVESS
jgi:hypothetical protein